MAKFPDVPDGHWAERDIDLVSDLGLIRGKESPEGRIFAPDDQITRAEIAAVLARLVRRYHVGAESGAASSPVGVLDSGVAAFVTDGADPIGVEDGGTTRVGAVTGISDSVTVDLGGQT